MMALQADMEDIEQIVLFDLDLLHCTLLTIQFPVLHCSIGGWIFSQKAKNPQFLPNKGFPKGGKASLLKI